MKNFKSLQAQHEELIKKVQAEEDVLDQARELIAEIKIEGSHITALSERDQLMANLRYWASYVYEKSGLYPNVELDPAIINTSTVISWKWPAIVSGVGAIALLFLVVYYLGTRVMLPITGVNVTNTPINSSMFATSIASEPSNMTDVEIFATQTALVYFPDTPSSTPTINAATPTATATETPQSGVISIQINSVGNGSVVAPVQRLTGTYTNLPAGYSIHVIVQPLSKSGLRYPMKEFTIVSPTSSSGEWEIDGVFGQGKELETKEEYLIYVVAAMDENARQKLLDAVGIGFQEWPSGIIPFPQTVSVYRAAYAAYISGVRLIYSSFLDDQGNYEIFSAQADGSDARRITYTSGFNEYFPSLSPDGLQIAYVGRFMNENNILVQSIDVMNSDGTGIRRLIQNQINITYESPLWSSDGKYIAYAVGTPRKDQPVYWNVFVYDLQENKSFSVTCGETTSDRYYSWIPNTHEIVYDSRIPESGTSGFMKADIQNPCIETLFYDGINEELQPVVSPDGELLAYTQLDNQFGNIYVLNLATKKIVQLTFGDWFDSRPVWSPDGKKIFFDSSETEFINIWSVNVDGSELTRITFGKDRYPFVGVMYALIPK